jgi:hypothetical protein
LVRSLFAVVAGPDRVVARDGVHDVSSGAKPLDAEAGNCPRISEEKSATPGVPVAGPVQ